MPHKSRARLRPRKEHPQQSWTALLLQARSGRGQVARSCPRKWGSFLAFGSLKKGPWGKTNDFETERTNVQERTCCQYAGETRQQLSSVFRFFFQLATPIAYYVSVKSPISGRCQDRGWLEALFGERSNNRSNETEREKNRGQKGVRHGV